MALPLFGGVFDAMAVYSVSFGDSGVVMVSSWGLGRSAISWMVSASGALTVWHQASSTEKY